MDRILIVPAAGRGSRLGAAVPKALVPVAGRPMFDHLLALHRSTVDRFVVVAAPDAVTAFIDFVAARQAPVDVVVQQEPTGMLDAIGVAGPFVASYRPRRVVITWCDQIAVTSETVHHVASIALAPSAPAMIVPTIEVDQPYVHFDRTAEGRIVGVRQRRERDEMPDRGEADMGLFDLSLVTYLEDLKAFASGAAAAPGTSERNFLPFIPWLASRRSVATIAGRSPIEAMGVNTPGELSAVEAHLLGGTLSG